MTEIRDINLRIIFDSRGDKTVEAEVITREARGIASCPSGASKSSYEVETIPKKGLENAIRDFMINVKPKLLGLDSSKQEEIDKILLESDGTKRLENYGASIILSVSIANLKAASIAINKKIFEKLNEKDQYYLPLPLGNVIGGGKHAKNRSIDIQEILVFCNNSINIIEAIEANIIMHRKLFKLLSSHDPYFAGGKNDEGALVTRMPLKKILSLVNQARKEIHEEKGYEILIGLDVAASSLWNGERYEYPLEKLSLNDEEQLNFILELVNEFDIFYIEDPFHEDSFEYFSELSSRNPDILVVGDDLYASNEDRLKIGIAKKASNGVIIKPNQVGCVSKVLRTINLAVNSGIKPIVSHRSGETEDVFISHLAVAFDSPLIKTGTIGGERISKLNELIRIAEFLKDRAKLNKLK